MTTRFYTDLGGAMIRAALDGAIDFQTRLALVTDAKVPTRDTKWLGDLAEIAAGNGYTAGGWDPADSAVNGISTLRAIGGPIPASGGRPRYLVVTDDALEPSERAVILVCDLGPDVPAIQPGQALGIDLKAVLMVAEEQPVEALVREIEAFYAAEVRRGRAQAQRRRPCVPAVVHDRRQRQRPRDPQGIGMNGMSLRDYFAAQAIAGGADRQREVQDDS